MPFISFKKRIHSKGIVILTTLISIVLFTGFISTYQAYTNNNIKSIKKLIVEYKKGEDRASLLALLRPLIADVIINYDAGSILKLHPEINSLFYLNNEFQITLNKDQARKFNEQPEEVTIDLVFIP